LRPPIKIGWQYPMNWDDLKIFLAIAETRGLKSAARKLKVHHSSCARRIRSFEAEIGAQLFVRLPEGYRLTDAGRELYQSATLIRDEFLHLETKVSGQDNRLAGPIKLTLPNGIATHLLMPDLTGFMQAHPDLLLSINMTYSYVNLADRSADVAIRYGAVHSPSLGGRKVGQIYARAYASTSYLAAHDPVNAPTACRWIGWGDAGQHLSWPGKKLFATVPIQGDLYSDVLQLAAAESGAGIASLPCFLGDPSPDLLPIADTLPEQGDEVWVLAHQDMMQNARVQALMDFLYAAFDRLGPVLQGKQGR